MTPAAADALAAAPDGAVLAPGSTGARLAARLAVATAFAMAAILPVVCVAWRTTPFADGSFFVLSILSPDPWGLAWESYPSRVTAFLLTILPPYAVGRLTGDGQFAIGAYGAIMGALPLASLLSTWRLAAPGSRWLEMNAVSTIVLAFGVTFFPTELWLAHALLWPLLALASRPHAPLGAVLLLALALTFTHEAGVPLAALALAYAFLATRRRALLVILAATTAAGLATKLLAPIANPEIARTVGENARSFFQPGNLLNGITLAAGLAVALFLILRVVLRPGSRRGETGIALIAIGLAAVHILLFPGSLHVMGRYIGRTITFVGLSGLLSAMILARLLPALDRWLHLQWMRRGPTILCASAVLVTVCALGHAAEAIRFLANWQVLEEALAGPPPQPDSMPKGVIALLADGRRIEGTAPFALPTGETIAAPDGAGTTPPPGPGWAVGWNWALPFHSAVTPSRHGADFIIVVAGSRFSPISCAAIRKLDIDRTLAPAARLRLLSEHLCRLDAGRSRPPS